MNDYQRISGYKHRHLKCDQCGNAWEGKLHGTPTCDKCGSHKVHYINNIKEKFLTQQRKEPKL